LHKNLDDLGGKKMSTVNSFSDYTDKYNTNQDYSYLFSNMQNSSTSGNSFSLNDYATIKNGSYKKLLRAYYSKQEKEKTDSSSKVDQEKKSMLVKDSADNLKKAAQALNDKSLWEKKKIKEKDAETGEITEKEDYDWDAITKAVQSFVDSYNDTIEEAGDSDARSVLRSTLFMTGAMSRNSNLLSKIGISIGKNNKLSLDKDDLKEAKISDLKSIFTGYNSIGGRVAQKAASISGSASQSGSVYNKSGSYYKAASTAKSEKVDEEV